MAAIVEDTSPERGAWWSNTNPRASVGYPVHYPVRTREWTNPQRATFTDWQAHCGATGTTSGRRPFVIGSVLAARRRELCRTCWPGGHHTRESQRS